MATVIEQFATGNSDVDGLLSGVKWDGTVSYGFPDSASDYVPDYYFGEPFAPGFAQISQNQQQIVIAIMASVSSFTGLNLVRAGSNAADIKLAQSSEANPTAYAYYPGDYPEGGDVWFGTDYDFGEARPGDYFYHAHIHEIGHALGLKHSHETSGVADVAVPNEHDSLEYSVMSYRSYIGGPVQGGYTNEWYGYPTTFMMNDILALQTMYGANYSTEAGSTVYSWSPASGEEFINGVGQGLPGDGAANRVFLTVWDGGGNDTYDLSTYTTPTTINLNPGAYSITSQEQRADLGDGNYAHGTIYNAYLFRGDARSYIENAIGGTAGDTIIGNPVANRLDGRGGPDVLRGLDGADKLIGASGNDFLAGGADADFLDGGTGDDRLKSAKGDDTLRGGAGTDFLYGGTGDDQLFGGPGRDTFFFDTPLDTRNNIDAIGGFSVKDDLIALDNDIFRVGPAGDLASERFWKGPAAHDGDDRIIYRPSSGALIYDANGDLAGGAIKFAILATGLAVTAADFIVV